MNRITKRFQDLKASGRKGLVTFVMAGDPDLTESARILESLPGAGADFIELGMPFSDPMADGPVIQAAGLRALSAGASMKTTLRMARDFRAKNSDTPLILMGYYNPVYVYGVEGFVRDAAAAGVDGLIIVDLPPEESSELHKPAQDAGLCLIRLIAPTTDDARLGAILDGASGFLYYVSVTGITGAGVGQTEAVADHLARIRARTDLPVAIGFGIRTPDDAARLAPLGDAIVVGSALVAENVSAAPGEPATRISARVRALRGVL